PAPWFPTSVEPGDERPTLPARPSLSHLAEEGEEHRVGAVPMRPGLDMRAATQVGHTGEERPCVDVLGVTALAEDVVDDDGGLGWVRRACHIGDEAAWPGRIQGRTKQGSLHWPQRRDICR